ncbi:MAG: HAD-IC family P-type ATPase [Clostridia bacterium]|nr:HAD-IC family P-type ATPase [Clostridia bacterium]
MGKNRQQAQIERVCPDLKNGLTVEQVAERTKKGFVNHADDPNEKNLLQIIASNSFTFFNIVLFTIASVFIFFIIFLNATGHADVVNDYFGFSKFVFLIPAIMNVVIGSFQEMQSLKVIKKLRIVTDTKARVVRDGQTLSIDAEEIVLDDLVLVSAGDQASADLTLLEGEVYVDESMLTGEADHVRKGVGDTILSGSSVIVGEARCHAVDVGNDTYAARLTKRVKSTAHHKSELMSSIMKIIKIVTIALGVALVAVVSTMVVKIAMTGTDPAIWDGMTLSLTDSVSWSIIAVTCGTIGIGMIPSGLVLTASVALMISIAQLTKKQTLIQELYSLENLSRVDVICLDKTGTLTDGTMNVVDVKAFVPMEEVERHARVLMAAQGERNATAEAIYQRFGIDENAEYAEKIPFSSAVKYSGLVYKDGSRLLMGAPEYLLPKEDGRLSFAADCAKEGKRVIALTLDGSLIAFFVIEDHIRDTAPDTLKFFRENGVTVKVISGDNPLTVSKIAQQCGIRFADRYISLEGVSLEEIPNLVEDYTVFARVTPEQKEALVKAMQEKGHKVAMTGDGVNDILALRRADSSITFAKATEAAKSCSDVVLLDNDFSHLKDVVGEGRRVISNIQKTAVLYLMKSIAVFIFAFALIPFAKGQLLLSVENMYMLEATVISTGGFLLSIEAVRKPIKGSFMQNILTQSIAAGILAFLGIILPLLLYTVPQSFGAEPLISAQNLRTMMTLLMTIAGFVVVFAMCLPFNRYRMLTMGALIGIFLVLGLTFPTSYIGGQTIGPDMLHYDAAAGETLLQSPLVKQMFQPQNSEVIQNLFADRDNFMIFRLFLYVAVPIYILIMFALENFNRRNYGKDVKKHRSFRIGRRLLLSSGFVLILHAILSAVEWISSSFSEQMIGFSDKYQIGMGFSIFINTVFILFNIAIGYIGYKVWKDPTKKMLNVTIISAGILLVLTVTNMVLSGAVLSRTTDVLMSIDSVLILVATALYIVGALIVRSQYHLGLDKARES